MEPGYGIRWQLGIRWAAPKRRLAIHSYVRGKRAMDLLLCLLSAPLILPLIALVAAIMLAVIAGLAIWGVTALFQREVILTKWS